MKYVLESELIDFIKREARELKRKRAFVSNMYGSGIVANGERIVPVFDSIDEILTWECPQNNFGNETLDSILSLCASSTNLDKTEVAKRLQNANIFGDFLNDLEGALKSIKYLFGTKIESVKRQQMFDSATKLGVKDSVMVRVPNENESVNDDILYLVSSDKLAGEIVESLRGDESLANRDKLYYMSFESQMTNE